MKGMKTGGRQKGTPNKENPLKGFLRTHSMSYFEPKPQVDINGEPIQLPDGRPFVDKDGNPIIASDFDMDIIALAPDDRVNAELRLLEFHTPRMKAVDMDMNVHGATITIEDRLRDLCKDPSDD